MADIDPTPSDLSTSTSRAEDQARIRKERREAKIRAGGSARLNKISGLGGGVQRDPPPQPTASTTEHDDPAEVDISNHYYEPARSSRPASSQAPNQQMNDDALRQMMLGFDPSSAPPNPNANPFAGFPGMGGMPGMDGAGMGVPGGDDPIMKMMQQMLGGGGLGEGPGGMPSFPGMPGQAPTATDPYAYLWRIVHAVFALSLGLYIALTTPFTGSKIARDLPTYTNGDIQTGINPTSVHFFYIFATAEVLLQSSRFYLEKGKTQSSGIMGMVMGFLPEPYKGYLSMASRYFRIWTTVSGDAVVCVFVLGVCAWLRGS